MHYDKYKYRKITDLIGKTLTEVTRGYIKNDGDIIDFKTSDGLHFRMFHVQDCCESVYLEDICGDLKDLECKIVDASKESEESKVDDYDYNTWTFYKIQSEKGGVTLRWYGASNGYYSEEADFVEILQPTD